MKKPRLPTPEELQHWRESNRHTVRRKGVKEIVIEGGDAEVTRAKISDKLQATAQAQPLPQSSPSGKVRAAAPLAPLTTREAAKRFKPHSDIEATLDLHGMTKLEAHVKVQQFITRAAKNGKRHVAIITGKGRGAEMGVLRSNLPDWLNEAPLRPLISGFAAAKPEKGGTGVTHVLLKRPR